MIPNFGPLNSLLEDLGRQDKPLNRVLPDGAAVIIRDLDGRILFKDASKTNALSTHDMRWVASCSKLVTPIALLQLVEQGKLELDQPVQDLLPDVDLNHVLKGYTDDDKPVLEPVTSPVTLRQLCDHTSGVAYNWLSPDLSKYLGLKITDVPTGVVCLVNSDIQNPLSAYLIKGHAIQPQGPLLFQPGTGFAYSPGKALLQYIPIFSEFWN